jgi:AcrR family transcriptional regulator
MSAPKAPGKRLARADREALMLDAAESVFAARSFDSASMEEIATGAGITKALLYQYFGSKDGLYAATVERGRARLFDELRDAYAAGGTPRERTIAFTERYFQYVAENRGRWWLLYGQASSTTVNAMRGRNAEVIGELLRGTLADEGAAVPDTAMEILAHAIVGAGEQVGRWWAERPEVPQRDVVAYFVAALTGAIEGLLRQAALDN